MTEQHDPVDAIKSLVTPGAPPAPPSTNGHFKEDTTWIEESEHYTDLRLAHRLVAIHGENIRYCHPWNTWLIWNGQQWARDDRGTIDSLTQDVVLSLYQEAAAVNVKSAEARATDASEAKTLHAHAEALYKWAERSESAPRLAAAEKVARNQKGITILPKLLDEDPWLLNVLNGTIDLRTGERKPHDKAQMLTKMAPVMFDPEANLELWLRFLTEAIPDEETRDYVQRCVGATAVGKADDDMLLICHGQGGTGKGTFLNSIQRSLGDYAAAADLSTFTTARDGHGPQPDLARLQGRRMVAISEVDSGGAMALLKRATGGDPIITRSHHQETFEFFPQFTIWIICNDRPNVPHNDSGAWRRIKDIPFENKFVVPDTTIRPTLTNTEVAGSTILNWVIAGCLAWQNVGVGQSPTQVIEATEAYREDMDPLLEWLEERCLIDEQYWTPFKALFDSYTKWAKDSNIEKPLGRKAFPQRLKDRFLEENRYHNGGRGYIGIALLRYGSNTSQVLRSYEGQVDSTIEPSYGKNQEVSVASVAQRSYFVSESQVLQQAQTEVLPSVADSHQVLQACAVCGGDDFRYTAAGEMVCVKCQPE